MSINRHEVMLMLRHWQEDVPNDRMAHLIKDVERAQRRALTERLSKHGISFGHWAFLRILWNRDGITQKELSDLAGVMTPTTFGAVQAMEQMGLIERRYLPGNRRNRHVFLTRKGQDLKETLIPCAEDVNSLSLKGITDDERLVLRRLLLTVLKNLAEEELLSEQATANA